MCYVCRHQLNLQKYSAILNKTVTCRRGVASAGAKRAPDTRSPRFMHATTDISPLAHSDLLQDYNSDAIARSHQYNRYVVASYVPLPT